MLNLGKYDVYVVCGRSNHMVLIIIQWSHKLPEDQVVEKRSSSMVN